MLTIIPSLLFADAKGTLPGVLAVSASKRMDGTSEVQAILPFNVIEAHRPTVAQYDLHHSAVFKHAHVENHRRLLSLHWGRGPLEPVETSWEH